MKNIKYIKNILFCIEGEITYNDLFTDKYNGLFNTHMNCNYSEYLNVDKKYVEVEIEKHNEFERILSK